HRGGAGEGRGRARPRPVGGTAARGGEAYRERLLAYSGALSLLAHRAPHTPNSAATHALMHRAFTEAGLRGDDVVRASDALHSYCLGSVVHQVRHATDEDAPDEEESTTRFTFGLRALLRGLV